MKYQIWKTSANNNLNPMTGPIIRRNNNQNSNNLYKNTNIQSSKQQFKVLSTHPKEENQKNIKKNINKKNNNNHNIVIKESNATISTSYNNEINRKFNSTNQNLNQNSLSQRNDPKKKEQKK